MNLSNLYAADFETTTDLNDCRVWAYSITSIENPDKSVTGNSIEEFWKYLKKQNKQNIYYFHNLKFDGQFIVSFLIDIGYKYVSDRSEIVSRTFTSLITDDGMWYSLSIYPYVSKDKSFKRKIEIRDSLKLLNFSVDQIAKDFNLPISKLKIDYKAYRSPDHKLTDEEKAYVINDTRIMAMALNTFISQGFNKMTIGSNALESFKNSFVLYDDFFPQLSKEVDSFIRKSYKGGFTYLNPIYKNKHTGKGSVMDVNSLYPSVMYDKLLPYDIPVYYTGKFEKTNIFPLYIQHIACSFEVKKNHIPTIQLKNNMYFNPIEYLETTKGDIVELYLTNVDLELFLDHYNVKDLIYIDGFKFKGRKGIFKNYIDYWTERKISAKKEGNNSMYLISKLFLNSLYGKFGSAIAGRKKIPYLDENGILDFKLGELEERKTMYIPLAAFITSYARNKTIRSSQKINEYSLKKYGYEAWVYSDTDSMHIHTLSKEEIESVIECDEYKLGYWKYESVYLEGQYIRSKCYMELQPDGSFNVTVAGLPKKLGKYLNFDNFKSGFSTENIDIQEEDMKLTYKVCKGGVVLVPVDFTIK